MAKGFKHGAGSGVPLSFKVVGGTAAPSNPKENTIWVNTATAITGWAFSAKQPETAANGTVWFSVGTSAPAEFNALKKNSVMVYPMAAKQYVSGAWVEKDARIYKSGQWLDITGYLYKYGTWYNGTALTTPFINGTPAVTYKSDAIHVLLDGYEYLYMHFPNREDLTNKTKLCAKFYSYAKYTASGSEDYRAGIRIAVASAASYENIVAFAKQQNLEASKEYTLELDVSKFSGEYYIFLQFVRDNSGTVNVDTQEVWLQ